MIVQYEINIPGSSINEKPNSTMSAMLCTWSTFVKKNSCLAVKTISFDTVKIVEFNIFELGIFSFNPHVYYLTRGFIASTRAFNLLTRAFYLPTRACNPATRAFSLLTRGFELVTRRFELVTHEFELVTRGFELVTRGFELVTRNSCFTFPYYKYFALFIFIIL